MKLGGALEAAIANARREQASLAMNEAGFAAYLTEKVEPTDDVEAAVKALHAADLFLVFAFENGQPNAERLLNERIEVVTRSVHAKVRTDLSFDELVQELRVHLFVDRPDRPARIHEFRGKSSLARWLHVAATRHALNTQRSKRREIPFEEAFFSTQPDLTTPEVRALEQELGEPLRKALHEAMKHVGEREQAILWFSLVDGMPAETIGKIYGVHRTTAARWVERAVVDLREALEKELAIDPGLRASELSSIVRSILARRVTNEF